MRTLDVNSPGLSLVEAVQTMADAPIVLTRKGRPVAILMPSGKADLETISLNLSPTFRDIIERSRRSIERDGGLTLDEVRRSLGIEKSSKNGKATLKRPKKRPAKK